MPHDQKTSNPIIRWKLITLDQRHLFYFKNKDEMGYLTPREVQVLLSMKNKTYRTIGKELNLSTRTIESYAQQLKKKLGVYRKSQISSLPNISNSLPTLCSLFESYTDSSSSIGC